MRNDKRKYLVVMIMLVMSALALSAQAQTSRAALNADARAPQQPLYSEYKGVQLGMTAAEVQAKLGNPAFKDKEMAYYSFSDTETAQVVYDSARRVRMITVDYANGAGAPAPRAVVGAELESMENGTHYKVVHYDHLGFWVSYSRTAGPVIIVTITIQKK
jgi:outer membrane protein assembly factor BamE (lipoprotein component of BamABCDE complex)